MFRHIFIIHSRSLLQTRATHLRRDYRQGLTVRPELVEGWADFWNAQLWFLTGAEPDRTTARKSSG